MGDPAAYLTPDVVVDFGSIVLEDDGPDRVRVSGIRGSAPTDKLKVSVSYGDGYKASGGVIVSGPDAVAKGEMFGEILWGRLPDYEDTLTEFVGATATWGPLSPSRRRPTRSWPASGSGTTTGTKIREFAKMVPAMVLSGPAGRRGHRWPAAGPGGRGLLALPDSPGAAAPAEVTVMGGGDRVEATVAASMGRPGKGRVPAGRRPPEDRRRRRHPRAAQRRDWSR